MAYSSYEDLVSLVGELELIQLTDSNNNFVEYTVIDQQIAAADARIDLALRAAGYALPLEPEAAVPLLEISRDITLYNLYGTRLTEHSSAYLRYKQALRELEKLGSGLTRLAITDTPKDAIGPHASARPPTYTNTLLQRL